MRAIADFFSFLIAVAHHWTILGAGGLLIALFALIERLRKVERSWRVFRTLAVAFVLAACFMAWRDEHHAAIQSEKARLAATAKTGTLEGELQSMDVTIKDLQARPAPNLKQDRKQSTPSTTQYPSPSTSPTVSAASASPSASPAPSKTENALTDFRVISNTDWGSSIEVSYVYDNSRGMSGDLGLTAYPIRRDGLAAAGTRCLSARMIVAEHKAVATMQCGYSEHNKGEAKTIAFKICMHKQSEEFYCKEFLYSKTWK